MAKRHVERALPVVVVGAALAVIVLVGRGIDRWFAVPASPPRMPPLAASAVASSSAETTPGPAVRALAPTAEREPAEPPAPPRDASSPEACSFGRVVMITTSKDDPRWSFASIAGRDEGVALRRVGDAVDEHRVVQITERRVWLSKDGVGCFLQLGGSAGSGEGADDGGPGEAASASADDPASAADWRAQVVRLNEDAFVIERPAAEVIAERGRSLVGVARARPEREGDRTVGLRLSRVRTGSLFAVLGLKNGDRLESINGDVLVRPAQLDAFYPRLATLDRVALELTRDGARRTVTYRLRD